MSIFCFFHIGPDISQPQMLVNSIRKFNLEAEIIYCTNDSSPEINGITTRLNFNGNSNQIILFRLKSFASSRINEPAIYLDTDMLCLKKFDPAVFLGKKDLYICERSFGKSALFNGKFRGMNYLEYDQKPLGEVYPYLGCVTVTKNSKIWTELDDICMNLDEKFKIWYGDQEALKIIAKKMSRECLGLMPEHTFACLPENTEFVNQATFLHFKGPTRKSLMLDYYQQIM